jgi:ABC-type Mn/Zn transport systems, ATPase component
MRYKELQQQHYIEVNDLSFKYEDEPVLSDITFTVDAGEFVMLTGENGAAKNDSTQKYSRLIKSINRASNHCIKKYKRK